MWLFGIDFPGPSNAAWDAIKAVFNPGEVPRSVKSLVLPAYRELRRLVVLTMLQAIWTKHLYRMEDFTVIHEAHNARAKPNFHLSQIRFFGARRTSLP